jgi:hypothetical protein
MGHVSQGGWSLKPYADLIARSAVTAMLLLPMSLAAAPGSRAGASTRTDPTPCHWWQFRRCDDRSDAGADITGLPDGAPRTGTVITVDLSTNTLYLFKDGALQIKSAAATGSGKVLETRDDIWMFKTPQGHMTVKRKLVDPVWRKPDWAYLEDGRPVPRTDHPSRYVKGHLGKYALDLGEGIMIHGTDDPHSIGRRVSHGCIRLPNDALAKVYRAASVGTDVFIFQSEEPAQASTENEHHSDLDYGKTQ